MNGMTMSKLACLDTNILVYLSQPSSEFFTKATNLVLSLQKNGYTLAVSSIGVGEYYSYKDFLELSIDKLIKSGAILELPFGHLEAIEFAELRKIENPRLPPIDILHLSTALSAGAEIFITNDKKLHKFNIKNIDIIGL